MEEEVPRRGEKSNFKGNPNQTKNAPFTLKEFGPFSSFDVAAMDAHNGSSASNNKSNSLGCWPSISENGSESKSASDYVKMVGGN